MLSVTKLVVRSFDLDHLDLFWEIDAVAAPRSEGAPHEIFDYDICVLRSGDSAAGPYERIGGPFRDTYFFRDNAVSLLHKWRQFFYKVQVTHRPTGETREFGPASNLPFTPDLVAAEIIRLEDVYFREFVGRKCWLFVKRTFGPRCSCWNPVLGRLSRSNHSPCFGTAFLGGYMAPIEVFPQIDPPGRSKSATALGEVQAYDTAGRMICFPPVSPGDILVEAENLRWRVISVSNTERLRTPVHQELRLHAIPKGDVEYALPVNVDLRTLEPAAARNFKNSQSLEPNDSYTDIVDFFGSGGRVR